MSIMKASSGLMYLMKKMFRDVMGIKMVEVPGGFFSKTFIRHLMVGTGETSTKNERVHALHENYAEFRFDGTRCRDDGDIYTYGAIKFLKHLKNHMIVNLERFIIRAIFTLCPGLSRQGIRSIISGITNDRQNGQGIEFVDKKASRRGKNEASVIRMAVHEHRVVLGLVKSSKKGIRDEKKFLSAHPALFRIPESRTRTQGGDGAACEGKNEESEKRNAARMGKRFNVVPLCNIKSHFVTVGPCVLYSKMKEIYPEFDLSSKEFTDENRETYWVNMFDFKHLKTSKQKLFTEMIETVGATVCVHDRRLKVDRPIPSSCFAHGEA